MEEDVLEKIMKVAISGASGLVGSALCRYLAAQGHTVMPLVRHQPSVGEIAWDPDQGTIDKTALKNVDAVIHLAGENIASGRWTPEQKRKILDSRVKGTSIVADAVIECGIKTFISASAVGFYGNRGSEVLTETSQVGHDFLADVCKQWETAANKAAGNARVVNARIGMVLSTEGGGLKKMLPIFKAGLGGNLGSGQQYMSWVALADVVRVLSFLLEAKISGPVNVVSPNPVTNAEFTRDLGKALHRPAIFPAPPPALRIALGEMADALLLSSQRAVPEKLQAGGFKFSFPTLPAALSSVLSEGKVTGETVTSRSR